MNSDTRFIRMLKFPLLPVIYESRTSSSAVPASKASRCETRSSTNRIRRCQCRGYRCKRSPICNRFYQWRLSNRIGREQISYLKMTLKSSSLLQSTISLIKLRANLASTLSFLFNAVRKWRILYLYIGCVLTVIEQTSLYSSVTPSRSSATLWYTYMEGAMSVTIFVKE